jgi:hypothetical protein
MQTSNNVEFTDLRSQWEKLLNGDHLTDDELIAMRMQIISAMPYLQSRGLVFYLEQRDAIAHKTAIEGYLKARGVKF